MPRKSAIIKRLLKQSGVDVDAISAATGTPTTATNAVATAVSPATTTTESKFVEKTDVSYAQHFLTMGA